MVLAICIILFVLSFWVEAIVDDNDRKETRAEKRNRELIEACEKYSRERARNKITKAKRTRTIKNTDGTELIQEETIEGELYD